MATTMRLYKDCREEYRDMWGKYCLYFPYPKWLQKHDRCKGYGIVCEPTESGMWRIEGIYNEHSIVNSESFYLGKKIRLDTMPIPFQIVAMRLQKLWNAAIDNNTDEDWEKWNMA